MGCRHRRVIGLIKVGSVCSVFVTSLAGECLRFDEWWIGVCARVPSPVSSSVLQSPA